LAQIHEPFTAQATHIAWVEITKPVKTLEIFALED